VWFGGAERGTENSNNAAESRLIGSRQIENEVDQYVPADEETEATVRRIAQESRKRKNVNIRISERDLSQIRERASREGVPYQTLIASVLHKYVTDQFYDEREIRKTLQLIKSSSTE